MRKNGWRISKMGRMMLHIHNVVVERASEAYGLYTRKMRKEYHNP